MQPRPLSPKHRISLLVQGCCLLLFCCTLLTSCNRETTAPQRRVMVPQEYSRIQASLQLTDQNTKGACEAPAPFTGELVFRSRYEGSDRARDQLNRQAEEAYLEATQRFTDLQQYMAKATDGLVKGKAGRDELDCLLTTLAGWAQDSALETPTDNHTGKAVRKWTLAALSSNLLKIDQLAKQEDPENWELIQAWLGRLADQVVQDYSSRPKDKINNHDYWAAWAVITTAALLDRPDLFDWSNQVYATAMTQVTQDGLLPNELRRRTRAAMYHNYALTPLAGIAVFLAANQVDPFQYNDHALARLCHLVLVSVDQPELLGEMSGSEQIDYDLTTKGRLSWLPMYQSLAGKTADPAEASLLSDLQVRAQPLRSSRMGGDLAFLFDQG